MKKKLLYFITVIVILSMTASVVMAEDGELFRRNISRTPALETEKSAVFMMDFYVPAQAADGLVGPVDNYILDDGVQGFNEDGDRAYDARNYAKPLISAYIDGPSTHTFWEETGAPVLIDGGIVFGAMDAFIGISLDDGTSWRTENISRSADLSSIDIEGEPYPGHVHHVVHQVAEDKILAVWNSKYCGSGFPLYSLSTPDNLTNYAGYLGDLETNYGKNAMYLYDLFGVAGDQGTIDYADEGYPDVGEIPFSCVWAARGKLLAGDDPMTADVVEASHVVWTAPERLTSGVRDANLAAVDCAKGAGCAVTWQEDPEGLRPGKGLGPGEGWSGAVANAKTDIWYSYISFDDFDLVDTDGDFTTADAVLIEDLEATLGTAMIRPKPYVPMAMPVRITDNDMCKGDVESDPYCWIDFDKIDDWNIENVAQNLEDLDQTAESDFCSETFAWTNPGGKELSICITEDGRYMFGRVASTRVRMVLKPYFPDGVATDEDDDSFPDDGSAWLSFAAEESKALGTTGDTDGDGIADVEPVDIGKDMFYYSFDFAKPYNLSINPTILDPKPFIVQQGGQINQPASCSPYMIVTGDTNPDATCPADREFFDIQVDEETGYEYYLTEIARRFALTLNNIGNITNKEINDSGLSGMLIFKQGIINQGGPADIMLRRVIVPDDFDPAVDNPFAFENIECDEWAYDDGSNPNYLQGLCLSPAINITGTTIVTCTTGSGNEDCAADFPVDDEGSIPEEITFEQFPKVTEWRQCDGTAAIEGCENDVDKTGDLDDQTWENPFDISKGHRGFLYGDFVMMMYAWSPNWNANSVGNDHYNLYQRRSFDGGLTWTTTPALKGGEGITALDYNYGETIGEYVAVYYEYGPGEFEQGRNLSLLHGNKVTILDPRYSPPGGLKQYPSIATTWLDANADLLPSFEDVLPYADDAAIDPSKFYMVYETGDNTTVAEGEATPLDLYYSRATVYGDVYEWFDYLNDTADCAPDPLTGEITDWLNCVEPRWPWLENAAEDLSGEASVILNPGGTFAYNVWNQWREEITYEIDPNYGTVIEHELIYDSDMWFRRLMWLPDDDTTSAAPIAFLLYTGPVMYDTSDDDSYVTFVATGRDIDNVGDGEDIVEYEFFFETPDGYKVILEDCNQSNQQICNMPTRTLSEGWAAWQTGQTGKPGTGVGWATMGVRVKDNDAVGTEGISQKVSKDITKKIYLATTVTYMRLPVVLR